MPSGRRFALTYEYPDDDDAWHFGPAFEVVSDHRGERLVLFATVESLLDGKPSTAH
ncbi:MAG TPA: hypothetical protein VFX59_02205 [Polyangiales bacterium]|nr:hypothetical protein [Polyangiales bacterium]